jgi:TPR repeat protein
MRVVAEKCDVKASNDFGGMLLCGDGVEKNPEEAAHRYRFAAELGHADAQCMLALLLARGEGVAQDPVQAIRWGEKATEQGSDHAALKLHPQLPKVQRCLNCEGALAPFTLIQCQHNCRIAWWCSSECKDASWAKHKRDCSQTRVNEVKDEQRAELHPEILR